MVSTVPRRCFPRLPPSTPITVARFGVCRSSPDRASDSHSDDSEILPRTCGGGGAGRGGARAASRGAGSNCVPGPLRWRLSAVPEDIA